MCSLLKKKEKKGGGPISSVVGVALVEENDRSLGS